MAKNKEFIYNKTRELGMLNGSSVETGYYTIDGEAKPEKVYLITRFMRKDGTEDMRANALCSIEDAPANDKSIKYEKTAIFLPDYDDDITFRNFYRLAAMQLEKISQE